MRCLAPIHQCFKAFQGRQVKRSSSWIAVLPSLVIPVCLGMMMYLGLSYMIDQGQLTNETLLRYITGHPVSKVTVGMFFIGMASLFLIANNVFEQFIGEKKIRLDGKLANVTDETTGDFVETTPLSAGESAIALGQSLNNLPKWLHDHYLWQRLQNALHSVYRTNSTEGVEDELKYLADQDLDQQQQRYSLVRILIWATPMLGFLGTVLGISQALGGINVGPENNFQTMMDGLRGSLYVAFDTTALALTLSMFLMFAQFLVDRFESQLLLLVDHRAQAEINRSLNACASDSATAIASLSNELLKVSRDSTEQQTAIWKKTIRSAEQAWVSTLTDANTHVQSNMSAALDDNVSNLAHYLGEAIDKADTAMTHRWQQWQVTLSENARMLEAQQRQLCEQTELLQGLLATRESPMSRPSPQVTETAAATTSPISEMKQADWPSEAKQDVAVNETSAKTTAKPKKQASRPEVVLPESNGEGQRPTINFQAYLHGMLSQSAKREKTEKQIGSHSEVILPFRFVKPADRKSNKKAA